MATAFLLIRHGLTDAVVERVLTGRLGGVPLNAAGRAQAARLADMLARVPVTAVVSSPLERTRATAAPIADRHHLTVALHEGLHEFDLGAWSGRSYEELDRDPEWIRFNQIRSQTRAPGGESLLDVQRRAVDALMHLERLHPGGVVVAVSHGDVIKALLFYYLGMPIDFVHRIQIDPARISSVRTGADQPQVLQVNGDSVPPLA